MNAKRTSTSSASLGLAASAGLLEPETNDTEVKRMLNGAAVSLVPLRRYSPCWTLLLKAAFKANWMSKSAFLVATLCLVAYRSSWANDLVDVPPPAPSSCPNLMVFFPEGAATLAATQLNYLSYHVAAARGCDYYFSQQYLLDSPSNRICVEGHTDDVEAHSANPNLSQKRAEVVSIVLVEAGVPRKSIVISALHNHQPLTIARGHSEQLNRRVVIRACTQADRLP
ncbi:OmpA family protein [Enhydrobacter aerosaccus]|uniref:OmpA family protein n=1 Tax=Enhydrobacter aerosaccus TaxID=225324 RepID=A0A1T4JUD7_9HYPH|nr:OmpA family protein [Enhydrobacter aerosaccus]